ncbi:MAG: hypothetical protein AAGF11_18715 [Myxococcota bacterium]
MTDAGEPSWLVDEDGDEPSTIEGAANSLVDARERTRAVPGFDLAIAKAGADIALSWADQAATEYEVWTSDDPYFAPTDAGASLLASGIADTNYTHTGGNDASDRYYRVQAIGGAEDLSTTAGMITHELFNDYTPMGQCLISEVDTSVELANDIESPMDGTHVWDPATQAWAWSWGAIEWTSLSWMVGQSVSVSHYDQDPPVPGTYTIVGLVPDPSDVAVPMLPGINLVTTVRSHFDTVMASDLLAGTPGAVRIGLWDSNTQNSQWYPTLPDPGTDPDPMPPDAPAPVDDFEIPPCATVQIEVTETSTWPEDVVLPITPQTCADILTNTPGASDGEYTLYYEGDQGQPWTAYCLDMAGTPADYLVLPNTGPDVNFSQYTAGGASPGTDVRTNYDRIRIDPITLAVDIDDQTFGTSNGGQLFHGGQSVTSMPYAIAEACVGSNSAVGIGNIDLTGTPFTIASAFCHAGFLATGTATIDPTMQVAELTGGGFCGWTSPSNPCAFNPHNVAGTDLELAYGLTP